MSAPKRKADAGEQSPVVREGIPSHRVGDIVLYAHRFKDSFELVPMIITKTYPSETTVDGVVLCTDIYMMTNNAVAKPVRLVQKGTSEGTWQPRR